MALAEGGKNMLLAAQRTRKARSLPGFGNRCQSPLSGVGVVQLYILEVDCFSQSFGIGEQIWRKWGHRICVVPFSFARCNDN